ncbi:MAG TPA: peroxiredoxin-like family protein [Allosphingosinicella sp.]|nr:peroxiredoxin-like family protein [Allosphingosinicella sp.]
MENSTPLADALTRCREGDPSWEEVYDSFVTGLNKVGIGQTAPMVGDRLPEFALPDARGIYVHSQTLLDSGPLVLSFNRGGWCPYCRAELGAWADAMPELWRMGGSFVSITPEVGGRAAAMREALGLDAEVLCDVDHGVALELGLAFHLGGNLRQRYLACGLDLSEVYGSPSWFIPIPATFVVDRGGIVRFSFVDPDFRRRAEPADVLAALAALPGAN